MAEVYKVEEIAKKLNMNAQSVRIRIQRGELPGKAIKTISGSGYRYVIPKEAFDNFMKGV